MLTSRPNPARAIWISGRLEQTPLDCLEPRILELMHESRDPITLIVESGVGFPRVGEHILKLLRSEENSL